MDKHKKFISKHKNSEASSFVHKFCLRENEITNKKKIISNSRSCNAEKPSAISKNWPIPKSELDPVNNLSTDWRYFKNLLNNLFFSEIDAVQKGTKHYDEFWIFLTKYCSMQVNRKKSIKQDTGTSCEGRSLIYKFPLPYHKKHCISFNLKSKSVEELQARLPPIDLEDNTKKTLTPEMLVEFNFIVHLFLDFTQKQKFKKLKKLRESQGNLPIAEYKSLILKTIQNNNILILAGDTGCGKSTQIPQFLLSSGYANIACTQPRRIACISLCKRVAYETLNEYSSTIGYQIRFERKKTESSKVIFVTEGLLLRQISVDPMLHMYDILILDEIHERHLQTDFLLGIIKCLIVQRSDIKVILMSATINIDLFKNYFMGKAPVIQIPGRLYPIELKYFPITPLEKCDSNGKLNPGPYIRILQLIDKSYSVEERGDVLIFLSGIKEITTVMEAARLYAQQTNKWVVLSLHSTLSISEQEKVFDLAPEGVRKCIISTNIAETSVTIDGIRFVIDSGKVKEMSYDSIHKMQRLKEFWVSQASAEQRKGRAGRTGPGVCFRLYSKDEYDNFSQYSAPEVKRVPLDSLVLQMLNMGLPNIRLFPFIDPPPHDSLETALNSLKSHAALTLHEELTTIGNILSQIPLDVALGKMLIMGSLFHQLGPVLSLVSAMSIQSPFTTRAYRDPDCISLIKSLHSDHGDPFTLLSIYREWLYTKTDGRENSRRWCKKRGLEEQRFYEMTKLRQQFTEMLRDTGLQNLSGIKVSTSNERMKRHGELSQLRKMKKELFNEGPRKAKFLKLELDGGAELENNEDRDVNLEINDIDFKIRYDDEKLRDLFKASKVKSFKELTMLKVILCSGLYPNVAFADDHNTYKTSSEQFFHTKSKPFVTLHPNSVFAFDPGVLELSQSDIVELPGSISRFPMSRNHQLLAFVSLLETNKVYMVNSLRVPAAQTLLLFAHNIDSNANFEVIVFDCFIELTFAEAAAAQNLVFQAVRLRNKWKDLLELRIKAKNPTIENQENLIREADQIENELSVELVEFYLTEPIYSMKRLLDADVKVLHKGYGEEDIATLFPNPFSSINEACETNSEKGGVQLTEFLTYNCLLDLKSSATVITSFDSFCNYCDEKINLSTLERLAHMKVCSDKIDASQRKHSKENLEKTNPNNKEYFCEVCRKTYWLTIKDILKHKSNHHK